MVEVDYEGELGVVIGRRCSRASASDAMQYVAGYLCVNDVSGRKLDPGFERDPDILDRAKYFDWLIGKWCDTFSPIGPWLTTADEVPDWRALHLETWVNGERRQETLAGEMIHSVERTIAWCSALMTLEPGDVIATGTPAGVGSASGKLLQEGDVVEVTDRGAGGAAQSGRQRLEVEGGLQGREGEVEQEGERRDPHHRVDSAALPLASLITTKDRTPAPMPLVME